MILVDSNMLIDVITADPVWSPWSTTALIDAADQDEVAINPIIYAEVSIGYASARTQTDDSHLFVSKVH